MSRATHSNAALAPRACLKLARLIVDGGWPIPRAAERYDVSWRTAKKWAEHAGLKVRPAWSTLPPHLTISPTAPQPAG